ncbi:hypothetical protein ACHAWF_009039 [Thalassiosira exigua]
MATTPSDSDVSWDELGDAINVGRRQSLSSNKSRPSLPTIYASGKSTRDLRGSAAGGGGGGGTLDESSKSSDVSFGELEACARTGEQSAYLRPSAVDEGDEEEEEFAPQRIQGRRGSQNTKLSHSLRSETSWDDLGEEIAAAMRQSLMPNNDRNHQSLPNLPAFSGGNAGGGTEGPWNCPACTFLNENPLHLVCGMCGTAKEAETPAAAPAPPPEPSPKPSSKPSRRVMGSTDFDPAPSNGRDHGRRRRRRNSEDITSSSTSGDFRRLGVHPDDGSDLGLDDSSLRNSSASQHGRTGRDKSHRRQGRRRGSHRGSHRSSRNSAKSEISPKDDDSFGSFNSREQLRDFKKSGGSMGGHRRREEEMHRHSVSGHVSGGASVGSRSSRRSGRELRRSTSASLHGSERSSRSMRSSERMSMRGSTRRGGDSGYRKSTSMVEYHRHDAGHDSGSDGSDFGIGRNVGAGGGSRGSDECSDLSDEDTHYRDDRTVRTMRTIKTLRVPEGEVTVLYTDVQGSTSLWEADPLAMKKATDIHDSIIRKCYADHGGYEITTEGDAFNLAFQHPADAIGFALKAQLALYRAPWPEGILNHPDGCDNAKKKFRGFRVRMGMHHGPTTSNVHATTGRTIYQGEAVDVSKAIEKMSHGGQILTTVETWRAVSGMAEQFLGSPQVMDCGEHLLYDPKGSEQVGKKKTKRIFSKRIVQLVPNSLSYDFFQARGGQEVREGEPPVRVCGRVFPPLLSHGQLSTSFLNAPYIGNKVAMVFVYTDKMESVTEKERKRNHKMLAKYVRSHLMRLTPPGYECQEDKGSWMLAFDRIENGIKFGLDLKEDVTTNADLYGNVNREKAFRIGIHWGPFLSMGPHTVSGHADYFGPIVNRAARVAAQCEPGQVCVGVPMGDGEEPPDPGPSVDVDVLGVKQLKGISIEMAIFACRKRKAK